MKVYVCLTNYLTEVFFHWVVRSLELINSASFSSPNECFFQILCIPDEPILNSLCVCVHEYCTFLGFIQNEFSFSVPCRTISMLA